MPGERGETPRQDAHYTQVNIMFPASEVELPAAEKFNAFPPEAQKAILVGFQREQMERHNWLKSQQKNDHQINVNAQKFAFITQNLGTAIGGAVIITMLIVGTILILNGAAAEGVALFIMNVGGLIGVAIWGHKERAKEGPKEPQKHQLPPPNSGSKA